MSQIIASPARTQKARAKFRSAGIAKSVLLYFLLLLVTLFSIGPFLWILSTALKGKQDDLYAYPPQLFPAHPTFDNFGNVFEFISWGNVWNSTVIAFGGTILNVLFCAMAAYPLARYEFPGKRIVMALLLTALMLPNFTNLVVNYLTIRSLQLQDTLAGVILPTSVTVFGVILLRQGYLIIPKELEEAGRVDGASEWRIWWQLMLPLVGASLATLAVFTFVENWNNFLWPLIVITSRDKYPLTLALQDMATNAFTSSARTVAAGTILTILPILVVFVCAQRFFINGVTSGSVKG